MILLVDIGFFSSVSERPFLSCVDGRTAIFLFGDLDVDWSCLGGFCKLRQKAAG